MSLQLQISTSRQSSTEDNPHLVQGRPAVTIPCLPPHQSVVQDGVGCKLEKILWLIVGLQLILNLFIMFVLFKFMPPLIDSYVSRRIDERLGFGQQFTGCRPCHRGDNVARDTNCCRDNTVPATVKEVVRSSNYLFSSYLLFLGLMKLSFVRFIRSK